MGISLCKGTRSDVRPNEEVIARVIVKVKLLEILTAIAFSDMGDYLDFRPDGVKAKNLTEIDPVKLHALKIYRADTTRRSFCIRLHNKGKALTMLLKITGGLRSRMDLTNGV